MATVYRPPVGRHHRQQAVRVGSRRSHRSPGRALLSIPVGSVAAWALLRRGVYLDDEFIRRGPRVGLTLTLTIVALIVLIAFLIWAKGQP